jgi:hypothetical protein
VLNFGSIPISEREIRSECDATVEVIPRAAQITELATHEPALIENFGEVWIESDQGVEIDDRACPIGCLHTCGGAKSIRRGKFGIELDCLTELLPGRIKISSRPKKKTRVGGGARRKSGSVGSGLYHCFFRRWCRYDVLVCVTVSGRERAVISARAQHDPD